MQIESIGRGVARGAASLLAGATLGVVTNSVLEHVTYPEKVEIADIDACAKDLGSTALVSEVIPTPCLQDSPQYIPYQYNQQGNVYYSLPPAKKMRDKEKGVPAEVKARNEDDRNISIVSAGIFVVTVFALPVAMDSMGRRQRRKNKPTVVKPE